MGQTALIKVRPVYFNRSKLSALYKKTPNQEVGQDIPIYLRKEKTGAVTGH